MVSRQYTMKSIADLLERYYEALSVSRAIVITLAEKGREHDKTDRNKVQISRCVAWAFWESWGTFELEFRRHSVLFAWSRLCFHPGNNDRGFLRGYSQRIFSMSTFEAIMHIEDSKENQEDKRLSQRIEFLWLPSTFILGNRISVCFVKLQWLMGSLWERLLYRVTFFIHIKRKVTICI